MAAHGRDIRCVDALIVSHYHRDHSRCAGIYQRKFGVPVYATGSTEAVMQVHDPKLKPIRRFSPGESLTFGSVQVHTLRTPHDASDSVAFVVQHDGRRLGILTDLGHPFASLARVLDELDAAYLEANHDTEMLASGPYPEHLKARIRGSGGHLSNAESASLVRNCRRHWPGWIALSHLSGENNSPDVAFDTFRRTVGQTFPCHLAPRDGASPVLDV